jgi:hypothetical protein
VKPYYIDDPIPNTPATDTPAPAANNNMIIIDTSDLPIPKKGRGHPRGSKNKLCIEQEVFLIAKKQGDLDLFIQLRLNRVITEPGVPFQATNKKEIDSLLAR